jgi:hypothetical protein
MLVKRILVRDEVIVNKILEMQSKYLDTLFASNNLSTDWLIENNQEGFDNATTEEEKETIVKNIEELKRNQKNRIRNADYYKSQIEFLQSILLLPEDSEFEINTNLKEFNGIK